MGREDKFFLLGLLSLTFSFFLFPFAAYLFPAVWLGWEYKIPTFVVDIVLWMQVFFNTSYPFAFLWFFRITVLLALAFGGCAYFISRHITKIEEAIRHQRDHEEVEVKKPLMNINQEKRESLFFFLKMVAMISFIFMISMAIQWAISLTTEPTIADIGARVNEITPTPSN